MAKGLYVNEHEFKTLDEISLENEIATRSVTSGSFAGWFNIIPDPDPILQKLGESHKVYKDLIADDQVGSTSIRLRNEVKSMEWRIKPPEGLEDNSPEMNLCKDVLESLKDNGFEIEDVISQSLNPHFWGLSVFEANYDQSKKPWLPVKFQMKPLEWFNYDTENNLNFRSNINPLGIPLTGPFAEKRFRYMFFTLRNEPTFENPYGDKALSRCFWPVAFKRGGLKFLSLFIEKYGMPTVEIKHPPGIAGEQLDNLVRAAALMIQDSVIAIPDGNSITVHRGGEKQSGELYKMYIDMCDAMIDKSILLTTLATSQQSKGGYSSASAGDEVVKALGKQLKKYPQLLFNKLFRAVIDLNIGSGRYPIFSTYEEEEANKEFAEVDKTLSEGAQASGQQIKRTKKFYTNRFNYKEDEFEIVDVSTSPTPPVVSAAEPPQFSEAEKTVPAVNIPDKLSQLLMEKVLAPVIKYIDENADRITMLDELAKIYPQMNTTELETFLTNLIFIYSIQAQLDAQKEAAL
jgi:phage gp29-like protein